MGVIEQKRFKTTVLQVLHHLRYKRLLDVAINTKVVTNKYHK